MKLKNFIKATWELPQNTIGLLVKTIFRARPYTTYKDAVVYSWKITGGISLGKYIFVPTTSLKPTSSTMQNYIKHEYGHTIQSKYFGWLYLPVISIPSFLWASYFVITKQKPRSKYYTFYTEKWADKLGGVDRK